MDNAADALYIAVGILIGLIILSVGVILFSTYSNIGEAYELEQSKEAIAKFNSKFTKFEDRTNITTQEIVSIHNFIKEYNAENDANIQIEYPTGITNRDLEFIKEDSLDGGEINYFKCVNKPGNNYIKYDEQGRVSKIKFSK